MLERIVEDECEEESNVSIMQNTASGELGATVWDAALVFLASMRHGFNEWRAVFKGRRVLDMSCGTGVVGIALQKVRYEEEKKHQRNTSQPLANT